MSIKFAGLFFSGLLQEHVRFNPGSQFKWVVTVNSDFIYRANKFDFRLANIINKNISTFDGALPFYFAKLLNPASRLEKISGSDLIYNLCESAQSTGRKVMIFGGNEESNKLAVAALKERYPSLNVVGGIVGFSNYPFSSSWMLESKALIEASAPDVFVCCLGSPKQEYFIEETKGFLIEIGVQYAIGAGGTVDFLAGKIKRAPWLLRIMCLEGVFRLIVEPNRMRFYRLATSFFAIKYFFRRK